MAWLAWADCTSGRSCLRVVSPRCVSLCRGYIKLIPGGGRAGPGLLGAGICHFPINGLLAGEAKADPGLLGPGTRYVHISGSLPGRASAITKGVFCIIIYNTEIGTCTGVCFCAAKYNTTCLRRIVFFFFCSSSSTHRSMSLCLYSWIEIYTDAYKFKFRYIIIYICINK